MNMGNAVKLLVGLVQNHRKGKFAKEWERRVPKRSLEGG
jgi:hypothetical protein